MRFGYARSLSIGTLFWDIRARSEPENAAWMRGSRISAQFGGRVPATATYPSLARFPGLPGINGGLFGAGAAGPGIPGVPGVPRMY